MKVISASSRSSVNAQARTQRNQIFQVILNRGPTSRSEALGAGTGREPMSEPGVGPPYRQWSECEREPQISHGETMRKSCPRSRFQIQGGEGEQKQIDRKQEE